MYFENETSLPQSTGGHVITNIEKIPKRPTMLFYTQLKSKNCVKKNDREGGSISFHASKEINHCIFFSIGEKYGEGRLIKKEKIGKMMD